MRIYKTGLMGHIIVGHWATWTPLRISGTSQEKWRSKPGGRINGHVKISVVWPQKSTYSTLLQIQFIIDMLHKRDSKADARFKKIMIHATKARDYGLYTQFIIHL